MKVQNENFEDDQQNQEYPEANQFEEPDKNDNVSLIHAS